MQKVNSDNIFPGAKISFGKQEFYVYKVNEKSAYIGTTTFSEVDRLVRGSKFSDVMKNVRAKKITYSEGYTIADEEVKKKEIKKDLLPAGSSKKLRPVSKLVEADIIRRFRLFKDSKSGSKNMIQYGKEEARPIVYNENGQVLFVNADGILFFYDIDMDEYTLFDKAKNKIGYGNDNIVWPREQRSSVEVA